MRGIVSEALSGALANIGLMELRLRAMADTIDGEAFRAEAMGHRVTRVVVETVNGRARGEVHLECGVSVKYFDTQYAVPSVMEAWVWDGGRLLDVFRDGWGPRTSRNAMTLAASVAER